MTPLVLLIGLAHAQSVPAPDGLVSWWPAEESADDAAGANHGSLDNVTYGPGMVGQAFTFGGTPGMVEVPEDDSLDPGIGDFTVESWIQTTTPNVGIIGCKRGYGAELGWCLYLRYGYPFARVVDDVGNLGRWGNETHYLADGSWHHFAMTVDRASTTGAVFYVDGVEIASFDATVLTGSVDSPDPLYIGRDTNTGYASSQYWVGSIDEFSYYDRALTADEVADIAAAGSDGKASDSCGDGVVDDGEECDGADLDGETCESLGAGTGTLSCSEHCTFDDVACEEDEVCDDGADNDGDGLTDCDDDDCDCDGTGDGGDSAEPDTGAPLGDDGSDGKGGCSCAVGMGAAGPALLPVVWAFIGLARRRD